MLIQLYSTEIIDLSQTFNQHNPQHVGTSVECWFTQAVRVD